MKNALLSICLLLAFAVVDVTTAAEGNSVAGLKVTVERVRGSGNAGETVGQTTTGPDGYYMIRGLGPGFYIIHVEGRPDKKISLGGGGNVTGKVKPK
jgi:hypothetical protein